MESVDRSAVRAVLVSEEREVLLMRIRNPGSAKEFWICPGGGLLPGETEQAGLARELREELGLAIAGIGPEVHRRHHGFEWKGEWVRQHERFYLVRARRFTPVIHDPEEALVVQEFRWWNVRDLDSALHPITPTELRDLVEKHVPAT